MTASVKPRPRRLQPSLKRVSSRWPSRNGCAGLDALLPCRLLTQGQYPVRQRGQRHIVRLMQHFPDVALAALVQRRWGNDIAPIAPGIEARTQRVHAVLTWLPGWAKT